jgi:hypothetical protein
MFLKFFVTHQSSIEGFSFDSYSLDEFILLRNCSYIGVLYLIVYLVWKLTHVCNLYCIEYVDIVFTFF